MNKVQKVTITKDGPYLVSGSLPLAKEIAVVGKSGEPEKWKRLRPYKKQESYALCRCGESKNKPFCDGSHKLCDFNGTETASKEPYKKQAQKIEGPIINLTDAQDLCSSARFCHFGGGTWTNVKNSADPKCKKMAIQTACNCPSGRLVVWNKKTDKPIEIKFEQSVGLIEDPQAKVSGPIWLKGGIKLVSADSKSYEKRNRMALCRCGKSNNKPFCDGSHIDAGFDDGDESLRRVKKHEKKGR